MIAVIGGPGEFGMVILIGDRILCSIPCNVDEGKRLAHIGDFTSRLTLGLLWYSSDFNYHCDFPGLCRWFCATA